MLALLGARAGAQAPVVEARLPVGEVQSLGPGHLPAMAVGADGAFMVVWESGDLIVGRAFGPDRQPLGGQRALNPSLGGGWGSTRPRVGALPDGSYLVAWEEQNAPVRLLARRVDHSGVPQGDTLGVGSVDDSAPLPFSWVHTPSLAVSGGVATLAWRNRDGMVRLASLMVADGRLQQIGAFEIGPGYQPTLAAVPDGLVAVWLRFNQIVFRFFASDASPRGPEQRLELAGSKVDLSELQVTADAAGRFTVGWIENYWRTPVERIRAQPFGADGTPSGDPVELVANAEPIGLLPVMMWGGLAAGSDGSLLLTWTSSRGGVFCTGPAGAGGSPSTCGWESAEGDVYARSFAADGTLLGQTQLTSSARLEFVGTAVATPGGGWTLPLLSARIEADRVRLVPPCGGGDESSLCLGGRFRVEVGWKTARAAGRGHPFDLTPDTGAFWFFSPSNVELVVKVLDGTTVNDHFWVYFASLTDVEFDLAVTDTVTGTRRTYHNPAGVLASRGDATAFPRTVGSSLASTAAPSPVTAPAAPRAAAAGACPPGSLCLGGGRFAARVTWELPDRSGVGVPVPWTADSGAFWFFGPRNVELALKVLDGRSLNGHFWVFFGGLTDVEFDLEVVDTASGQLRTYHHPRGAQSSRADVEAF
jgi:hypothetical protein